MQLSISEKAGSFYREREFNTGPSKERWLNKLPTQYDFDCYAPIIVLPQGGGGGQLREFDIFPFSDRD